MLSYPVCLSVCICCLKCVGQSDSFSECIKLEAELRYNDEWWFLVYVLALLGFVSFLVICLPNS
jgi:hypothetical protein